jgi:hypothetical protein
LLPKAADCYSSILGDTAVLPHPARPKKIDFLKVQLFQRVGLFLWSPSYDDITGNFVIQSFRKVKTAFEVSNFAPKGNLAF